MSPVLGDDAYLLVFPLAVVAAAWYGGLSSGIAATGFSALLGSYFLLLPVGTVEVAKVSYKASVALFICEGVLISFLIEALHRARMHADGSLRERLRYEERSRHSEEQLRLVIQSVVDYAFIQLDCDGRITGWNTGAQRIKGYTADEITGCHFSLFYTARDRRAGKPQQGLCAAAERGHCVEEGWRVRKDGSQFWAETVLTALRTENGTLCGYSKVTRDRTERKRAELERDRFFGVGPDMHVVAGFDGCFKRVSAGWTELLGWSVEELTTRPWIDFVHPDDVARTVAEAEHLIAGQATVSFENRYRTADGQWRWLSWKVRTHAEEQLIYGAATDVTAHKLLAERLRQAEKMEAVGRLAGGVAHDFNNLLTVILGHSYTVHRRLPETHPLQQKVAEIQKAGQRAAALTGQLLAFSRKQVVQPRVLDLHTVIRDMEGMLHRLLGEDLEIRVLLQSALGHVEADASQMEQVIMNLALNARDAMPEGGKLTIETHDTELDGRSAELRSLPPGHYVMLAVSDTGCGMDDATRGHIFEPFFTTKEVGKGTGLGLSTVYGIVQQAGGAITVYSEPGQGTTFKMYLPRINGPVAVDDEAVRQPAALECSATILLVEDEPSVRELTTDLLAELGCRVLAAANGPEALRVAADYAGAIDLLITDVVMPGLSGPDLAVRLTDTRPGLRVLYISGYTDHALLHRGTLAPGVSFLQKPFTAERLQVHVHQLLGSQSESIV